jgi:hypothetical protein
MHPPSGIGVQVLEFDDSHDPPEPTARRRGSDQF